MTQPALTHTKVNKQKKKKKKVAANSANPPGLWAIRWQLTYRTNQQVRQMANLIMCAPLPILFLFFPRSLTFHHPTRVFLPSASPVRPNKTKPVARYATHKIIVLTSALLHLPQLNTQNRLPTTPAQLQCMSYEVCRHYNRRACTGEKCRYRHCRSKCYGAHPASRCLKLGQDSQQAPAATN